MSENMKVCNTCGTGSCGCHHHKVVPISIIIIGALFLAQSLGGLTPAQVDMWWPIFLIVIGVVKFGGHNCKCCGPNKV